MEEIWKDIPDYNGRYQASNLGRIKRVKTIITTADGKKRSLPEKIFKPYRREDGYYMTGLIKNKKNNLAFIHILIAKTFLPNPDNLPQVNHKDGNKGNNNLDNLEWVTCSQNTKHSYDILNHGHWVCKVICNETGEVFNSFKEAGLAYNMSPNMISRVAKGNKRYQTIHGLTFSVLERYYLKD